MELTSTQINLDLIQEWYKRTGTVSPKQLLDTFNFDCAVGAIPANDTKLNIWVDEAGQIYGKDHKQVITNPIGGILTEQDVSDLKGKKIPFTCNQYSRINGCTTACRKDFIYRSVDYPNDLPGKEWADFRQGLNHLNKEGITVNTYSHISDTLLKEIDELIKGWRATKSFVGYPPLGISKICHTFNLDIFVTAARYKGKLIHYFTSERINPQYVVLLDGKVINDDFIRKYQPNVAKAVHYMHIKHWERELENNRKTYQHSLEDFSLGVYYNMGFSDSTGAQFKRSLKPYVEQSHYYHTPSEKKGMF